MRRLGALLAFAAAAVFFPIAVSASPILGTDFTISDAVLHEEALSKVPPSAFMLGPKAAALPFGAEIRDTESRFGWTVPSTPPGSATEERSPDKTTWSQDSLKSVLRSIATIHRSRSAARAADQAPAPSVDATSRGLLEWIYDSELAGMILRALVKVKTKSDNFTVFSVLGMGDFVIEVESNSQSAIFYELSSGWSATLATGRREDGVMGYAAGAAGGAGSSAGTHENVNFVELIWDWIVKTLTSPMGILATMVLVIVLMTWALGRVISILQRRALGLRR